MTYTTTGPPPFEPLKGERILLDVEGYASFRDYPANKTARKSRHVVVLEAPVYTRERCLKKDTYDRSRALVGRDTITNARIYISTYVEGTQIQWLNRNSQGDYIPGYNGDQDNTTKEKAKLFTTRTQETKAGVVGQVVFEGEIVWESSPFPKGEYDNEQDRYEGVAAADKASQDAKKKAVETLFNGA
jgi:hypothetical protein